MHAACLAASVHQTFMSHMSNLHVKVPTRHIDDLTYMADICLRSDIYGTFMAHVNSHICSFRIL